MTLRLRLLALMLLAPATLFAQVTLVDVIPNTSSDETYQNAETDITFDPAHPDTVVASCFTGVRPTASNVPVFVSNDRGLNWTAHEIIPSFPGSWISHYDLSLRFAGSSSYLYTGFLQATAAAFNGRHLRLGRTNDPALGTLVTSFFPRDEPDQPFVAAATVKGWFDPGKDRAYMTTNDFGAVAGGTRSTVDYTLDATLGAPVNNTVRVETTVPGSGRDGHQCRPAVHPNGTVYVAFVRWNNGAATSADVVVVRDDNWGQGTPPFQALMSGMMVGVSVVTGVPIPGGSLGNQRLGGNLAIAVDPRDSRSVYVSYEDRQGADVSTLHLRHSSDSGATWPGGDLLVVHNAHNTAVAVNSHGRIGMLYQQFVTCGASQCWETHLRRSDNGTTWNDLLLARFTDGNPAPTYAPYLGDYDNLIADGKDFVGIFSSDNTPDTANFAPGVSFNRNANWMTHQLLGNDNTTVIANSIDPFYFRTTELLPTNDFYVRDWTDSATVHDNGSEPSIRDVFYAFSDVWNRRTNDPAAFNGFDQPQNQRAQPMAMGPNFAFARVSRNTHTTADSVSAHFLYSDGGVGVNYEPAGAGTIPFLAADASITPGAGQGVMWNLPSGASNHICLAVEIDTPGDPLIAPSLLHRAPGWPDTDLSVLLDNNKAQRNMEVYDGVGSNTPMPAYALVHNASLEVRDLILGLDVPKGTRPRISVVGGNFIEDKTPAAGKTIVLPRMQPGENRWISVDLTFPSKEGEQSTPVFIYEIAGNRRVNGYGMAARRVSDQDAMRENLAQQTAVLDRFGSLGDDACRKRATGSAPVAYARKGYGYDGSYAASVAPLTDCALSLVKAAGTDPFDLAGAASALSRAGNDRARIAAHLSLLNRLDAFQTMQQKALGDPADIMQMVSWQRALYRRPALASLAASPAVIAASSDFITAAERQTELADGYKDFLAAQLAAFNETIEFLGRPPALVHALDVLRSVPSDARTLEHAHREYLIALQEATSR